MYNNLDDIVDDLAATSGQELEAFLAGIIGDDPQDGDASVLNYHYWRRERCWMIRRRRDIDPAQFYGWKADPESVGKVADMIANELIGLIRSWQPVLLNDWVITTPPQGASLFKTRDGVYPAGVVGKLVSCGLGLDYLTIFERQEVKRWHSTHQTFLASPFQLRIKPPSVLLIVDDMITSGNTIRNCLDVCWEHNIPAWGFAWVGR